MISGVNIGWISFKEDELFTCCFLLILLSNSETIKLVISLTTYLFSEKSIEALKKQNETSTPILSFFFLGIVTNKKN